MKKLWVIPCCHSWLQSRPSLLFPSRETKISNKDCQRIPRGVPNSSLNCKPFRISGDPWGVSLPERREGRDRGEFLLTIPPSAQCRGPGGWSHAGDGICIARSEALYQLLVWHVTLRWAFTLLSLNTDDILFSGLCFIGTRYLDIYDVLWWDLSEQSKFDFPDIV